MGHCRPWYRRHCGQEGRGRGSETARGPAIALPASVSHWGFQGTGEPRDHYHSLDTQQAILEEGWAQSHESHTQHHTPLLCS